MGMMSEIGAEHEARRLEGVLKAALETQNAAVISFCRTHIVPLLDAAVGETWGSYKGDKTVRDAVHEFDGDLCNLQHPKSEK